MAKFNLKDLKGSIDSTIVDVTGGSTKTPVTEAEEKLAKGVLLTVMYCTGALCPSEGLNEDLLQDADAELVDEAIHIAVQGAIKEAKANDRKKGLRNVTKNAYKTVEKALMGTDDFPFKDKSGKPAGRWDQVIHSLFCKAFDELSYLMEEPLSDPKQIWRDYGKESRDRKKEAAEG